MAAVLGGPKTAHFQTSLPLQPCSVYAVFKINILSKSAETCSPDDIIAITVLSVWQSESLLSHQRRACAEMN